jgi:HAD superfamily hydrolase (TIGR01490 family)
MNLALFDFDGTISSQDSFLLFLKHTGRLRFYLAACYLSPLILLYLVKRYPNQKLKEKFLVALYKGKRFRSLRDLANGFCREMVPGIVRPQAAERIAWHQERGDGVCVVTATPRFILEPWCLAHGLHIIGTELDTDGEGRVTGKLQGKNCRGEEKVRRIGSEYRLGDYRELYAYGDTSGDIPMLDLARPENRFFKPFRTGGDGV